MKRRGVAHCRVVHVQGNHNRCRLREHTHARTHAQTVRLEPLCWKAAVFHVVRKGLLQHFVGFFSWEILLLFSEDCWVHRIMHWLFELFQLNVDLCESTSSKVPPGQNVIETTAQKQKRHKTCFTQGWHIAEKSDHRLPRSSNVKFKLLQGNVRTSSSSLLS